MKKHIPNIITSCNLICGCIATYCAFYNAPHAAYMFIILGAWFDFFDGLTARALGVSGKLGVELDSLADCVTFGVAPSAMLFTLFNKVAYPGFMANEFFFHVMPFTAFIMAAFSALRLAKFNLDERQHTGFLGLPTPSNAIFWASLICGCQSWLTSAHFNAFFLFMFMILACWLLVSEVPMVAFKFEGKSWAKNKLKYSYFFIGISLLIGGTAIGAMNGEPWIGFCHGSSLSIGLYVLVSIVASVLPKNE